MKTNFYLKPKSREHAEAIVDRLEELGYAQGDSCGLSDYPRFPDIVIDDEEWCVYRGGDKDLLTFDDLYDPDFNKSEIEELTLSQVCKELGREIKIKKG